MIMFIDMVCPKPYTDRTLDREPLGGTEATVVRIAEELGKTMPVVVVQHNRLSPHKSENVAYLPLDALETTTTKPKYVVAIRDPVSLPLALERWPNAKRFLWLHDIIDGKFLLQVPLLNDCKTTILTVSDYHHSNVCDLLLTNIEHAERKDILVKKVYNPIDDDLKPDGTTFAKHKLLFLSSPHKGLSETLACFKHLHDGNSQYQLFIANPGYMSDAVVEQDGVTVLGALPHPEVIKHVRSSMCIFYPNTVFPETYGLVMAEANAVGTPVLAHKFGAAREVTEPNKGQILDCRDHKEVCRMVNMWLTDGRPDVKLNKGLRLSEVLKTWKGLLK